jgi:hypothetical protein
VGPHTRTVTAGLLAAGLLLASAPTASAQGVEREPWVYADTFTEDLCGTEVVIDVEAQGTFTIRQQRPGSPAFLAANVSQFREVITDPETGTWFVIRGRESAREVTATHIEGDVYLFRQHFAGQRFVIEDRHGKVVYRDRGLVVADLVFDTLGDDAAGGVELSFEIVERRGHPGYLEDICPIVQELLR